MRHFSSHERAAVWRIDADGLWRAQRQSCQCGALGAVAVQHVGREKLHSPRNQPQRRQVRRAELAPDRGTLEAELQARRKVGEDRFGARAAGRAVDNQSDAMAALGLAVRHVEHVAKQSAERRPQDMQDLEARRIESGLRRS